jgi:hypothetical protein
VGWWVNGLGSAAVNSLLHTTTCVQLPVKCVTTELSGDNKRDNVTVAACSMCDNTTAAVRVCQHAATHYPSFLRTLASQPSLLGIFGKLCTADTIKALHAPFPSSWVHTHSMSMLCPATHLPRPSTPLLHFWTPKPAKLRTPRHPPFPSTIPSARQPSLPIRR